MLILTKKKTNVRIVNGCDVQIEYSVTSVTVDIMRLAALFKYTSVGLVLDLMNLVVARCSVFGRAHRGSTVGFLLLQHFSVGLAVEDSSCFISVSNPV